MAQQGPLPFLDVSGVEVANAARVLQYLRGGLANTMQGHFDVTNYADVCSVLYRHTTGGVQAPYGDPAPPVAPGQNYTVPAGATICTTQGQIDTAVGSGVAQNIVIEDGTYVKAGVLTMGAAHKIYARHAGLAKLQYGIQSGGTIGAELHGLYFDVTNPAFTLAPGIVHLWGTCANWKIQDCWFDGHLLNDNGVLAYACNGITVERIWARNFLDNGIRLNDNIGFASTPIIQRVWDVDVANVYRAVRGASNGTGESGIMLGHKVTDGVQRIKVRNVGWQGLALNSNHRDTTHTDLDIDQVWGVVPPGPGETGVGVYIERSCHNLVFTNFVIGPDLYICSNGEWDGGTPGTAGMNNVRFSVGTMSATRVGPATSSATRGIYGDAGGDSLFVDHVRFLGMSWACIGAYSMTNTPVTNFTNNDYSGRAPGAKRVVTDYFTTPVASLTERVASDGPVLSPTTSFLSPAADPAPWYDANEPGSTSFLGVVLLDINGYDSTIARAVTPKLVGLGGGSLARQRRQPRVWKFRAALVSADDSGAEYGLRWLTSVLQTAECDQCATGTLTVRLVCPPDDGTNDDLGKWTSYAVALTDGPREVQKWATRGTDSDILAGCRDLVFVEWEMTAGNPLLYKPSSLLASYQITQLADCQDICAFLFGDSTIANCSTVPSPQLGTTGTIVTLTSANGFGGVVVESYLQCPTANVARPDLVGGGTWSRHGPRMRHPNRNRLLPTTVLDRARVHTHERMRQHPQGGQLRPPTVVLAGGTAEKQIVLTGVPAGTTVTVDSSRRGITITATDPATGLPVVSDGSYLVDLENNTSIEWLEVRDCDTSRCICVRAASPCAAGTLDVAVWTQSREG